MVESHEDHYSMALFGTSVEGLADAHGTWQMLGLADTHGRCIAGLDKAKSGSGDALAEDGNGNGDASSHDQETVQS